MRLIWVSLAVGCPSKADAQTVGGTCGPCVDPLHGLRPQGYSTYLLNSHKRIRFEIEPQSAVLKSRSSFHRLLFLFWLDLFAAPAGMVIEAMASQGVKSLPFFR